MTTADLDGGDNAHTVAAAELQKYAERRENLESDKADIAEDIKSLNAEIKARGYDMKTFNDMIRLRKMDKAKRDEREALRTLYSHALGVFE